MCSVWQKVLHLLCNAIYDKNECQPCKRLAWPIIHHSWSGLVWKRVSPMDVITRGQSFAIFHIKSFLGCSLVFKGCRSGMCWCHWIKERTFVVVVCVLRETVFAVYNCVQLCSLCATLRICAILHHSGPLLGPIFVVLFSSKTFLFLDLIYFVSRTTFKVFKNASCEQ